MTDKCNILEANERNFKLALINMLKDLKENMKKSLNVICENKNGQWKEIMKTVQDMKMKQNH